MGYFSPTGRLFKIETVGDALGARIVGVTMDDAVGTGGWADTVYTSFHRVRDITGRGDATAWFTVIETVEDCPE